MSVTDVPQLKNILPQPTNELDTVKQTIQKGDEGSVPEGGASDPPLIERSLTEPPLSVPCDNTLPKSPPGTDTDDLQNAVSSKVDTSTMREEGESPITLDTTVPATHPKENEESHQENVKMTQKENDIPGNSNDCNKFLSAGESTEDEPIGNSLSDVTMANVGCSTTSESNSSGSDVLYENMRNEGSIEGATTSPVDAAAPIDATTAGHNVSPNNTYDVSQCSSEQKDDSGAGTADVTSDDSLADVVPETTGHPSKGIVCPDPNSSITEDSIEDDSLGNEAEDECEHRHPNSEEITSDSCDSRPEVPDPPDSEEQDSLEDSTAVKIQKETSSDSLTADLENSNTKAQPNSQALEQESVENEAEITVSKKSDNLQKQDSNKDKPQTLKDRMTSERQSFRKRMGSLRKNKKAAGKNGDEFSIEIFESKKPIANDRVADVREGGLQCSGSAECLPSILRVQQEDLRQVRAQSEPPQGPTTETSIDGSVITTPADGRGTASLANVGLDTSTTLSQTSESSSGVTGELSSSTGIEESPRKDSADPDRTVEEDPGAPIPPTSNSPSTSAGASDATAPYTSAPAPPPEVGPLPDGGGDGGSSIGSSEGGGGAARKAATAFTIDLDKDDEGDDGEGSGKKLDIGGPLSKWAPPKHHHRRNLSLTKVEENKKVDERGGKPPVYRARCGTMGAPGVLQRRPGGYHSEGYFSSDQDEDGAPRKTDMRGPRTPEGLKSPLGAAHHSGVSRSASQDFNRHSPAIRGRPPSPDQTDGSRRSLNGGGSSSGLITLNESANFLIEKMVNSTPETKRKLSVGVRPGDSSRQCCKGLDKKPSVADITGRSSRSSSDKGSKASTKVDARKHDTNGSTHTNCQPFKVEDRLLDRDEDEVSEAGTYTIDKDSSPELDKGRGDIERVFGLASGTAEVTTPSSYSSNHWEVNPNNNYKTGSSISRNSPNWIQQWAAQVAEQTSVGDLSDMTKPEMPSKATAASPRGSKMSSSMSQDSGSDLLRPRRKLPTPPTHHLQQQQMQGCFGGANTGSSTHLAELELISRRARVTDSTPITSSGGYQISSFESHDSGGDSDVDTSTSYATQDQRQPSSSTSLRNKLKLSGLESGSGPVVSKSRNVAPNSLINPRNASKLEGAKRGGELSSDGGYDAYLSQKEDLNNVHSDTSSETSEHLKDARKNNSNNNLNNPPLKYNRAFSLRRARLSDEGGSATTAGSSLPSTRQAPPTPTERRKVQQPVIRTSNSGGGSSLNSRRSPGTSSAVLTRSSSTSSSHQVVKSPSRSSISKKEATSSHQRKQHPNSRSNSTMSSKEVDFQNWKRRKNYDPMKAAKDAKKKQQLEKRSTDKSDNITSSERGSPSPPNSLLRSASFHGTEGMLGAPPGHRWPRPSMSRSMYQQHGNTYTSEDDGPMSYDDEQALPPAPHASPLRRSPTSPHQLNQSPLTNSPSIRPLGGGGRRSSCTLSDDSEPMHSSPSRKISIDDTGSEGKRSPLSIGQSNTSSLSRGPAINTSGGGGRSRTKIEALDNLVISTIHSLSVKVRGTSENLLQKLKSQYCNEDQDRAELLQSVLNHLNSESESATSQVRSTSRDLSGILKNLKKIQTALEVIDQVMAVGGADDDYVEDVDWAPSSSMGGASDY